MFKTGWVAKMGIGFCLLGAGHSGRGQALEISLGGVLTVMSPLQLTSTTNSPVLVESGRARLNMSQTYQDRGGNHVLAFVVGRDEFRFHVRKLDIFGKDYFESNWISQGARGQITGVLKAETLSTEPPHMATESCRIMAGKSSRWGEIKLLLQNRLQKKYWILNFMDGKNRKAFFTSDPYEERNAVELIRGQCQ